eukprot:scaffold2195_cov132-Cylindrotheca_fusiformis.AAC.5
MKRKRNQDTTVESSSDDDIEDLSFAIEDGETVELGDTVELRVPKHAAPGEEEGQTMIARVESIWRETPPGSSDPIFKFRARWFFMKKHVDDLLQQGLSSNRSLESCSKKLSPFDLILTNQYDDNVPSTICRKVYVVYRQPGLDSTLPTFPQGNYVCRFALSFGIVSIDRSTVDLKPYSGKNDDWKEMLLRPEKRRRLVVSTTTEQVTESGKHSDSDDCSSIHSSKAVKVGEGTIAQRDTRVGSNHQAVVPPFSADQRVVSRNPTLVWKADAIAKKDLNGFVERVSAVLYPYLKENRLTQEEPYSPLGWEEMETVTKATGSNSLPTLSTLCTATSLSESNRPMLREFDIDAIMAVLHSEDYDTEKALIRITDSPTEFLTVWSRREKEVFDYSFRKHAGSLRMVLKGISSSKSVQDIVDYHYRFKIPDQFRLFQNKNREKAVRMVESIEARRNINSNIAVDCERRSGHGTSEKTGWLETGTGDASGATRERRSNAKRVLLEIDQKLGQEKLAQLMDLIRGFHQRSASDLIAEIDEVFDGASELKSMFLDFLPSHLR